ncbi:MAG TPA: 2-oxoglutarate dehydrogenase, E2 component, dihydrolipoamide succinyltransferase [Candidatus Kapabacteria bacterium]|nr:2-oxoglutarate dehydrogenase, E2 component, dihydrolipoamide succinyltransferase [Candidatus Kapabacteria bacterium]
MKIEVVMPKMGESLQEGTITKWIKKVGDTVERDEMILEISTDKVDTEVPAPNSGILTEILVQEGTTVEVGSIIAYIETEASQASSATPIVQAPLVETVSPAPTPIITKEEPVVAPTLTPSNENFVQVVMPKMGESLQEGTVTKWLKKAGDKVERDEMILEISTDKVDSEVPSPVDGVLAEILVKENETVEVGTPIAKISTNANVSVHSVPAKQETVAQAIATPAPVVVPTPVATTPIQNITSGTKEIPTRYEGNFFSPLVKSIAEQNGIFLEELLTIKGTGIDGRVTKENLLNYINNKGVTPAATVASVAPTAVVAPAPAPVAPKAAPAPVAPSKPQVNIPAGADYEVIPMDRIRQLISEHMVYSKHTSAHVTSVSEVDVTNIVNYRNKHKGSFEKSEGYKLTYTPFFAQAVIDAVRQYPMVNVSVDGKNILKHRRINLGIATALPDGNLIVPVIKGSDMLNLKGISYSIQDLASRARNKKLNPDEIQGGTITLTNVGTFGTLFGTPVINQPQVVIFGVGAIKKRPVVMEIEGNDIVVVRHMMYVSITYDHRVVDGMLAGQTLAAVVKNLESMNENTISL